MTGQEPLRVLTTSYEFPPLGGGGGQVVAGLSQALSDAGHQISVVTMGGLGLPEHEQIGAVPVARIGRFRLRKDRCTPPEMGWYIANLRRRGPRILSSFRPDILHGHFLFPDGVAVRRLARLANRPFILTAHGSDVPGYNPDRFGMLHRLLAPEWRAVARQADRIICPSNRLAELIAQAEPDARTIVIPNGIDLDAPRAAPTATTRENRILVVSRLFARKGIQDLLEGLAHSGIKWPVTVVGDGPFRSNLESRAKSLGLDAEFTGWLDNTSPEMANLLTRSRIFAYPSHSENFPVALLEGMRAGLAILTTSGTGCDEVVGDAGVCVPPAAPKAIAGALRQMAADVSALDELGAAAMARVQEHFAWSTIAQQTAETMQEVLRQRR